MSAAPNLIIESVDFYFVWTKTGRPPRFRHNTFEEACAEADRLANLKPHGKKYIVLRGLRKCHVPPDTDARISPSQTAAAASVHPEVHHV